jgi:hypothetical protein
VRTLIRAHKLLIGAAVALALVLAAWALARWRATHRPADLALALLSAAAVPVLAAYLAHVFRKYGA